MTTHDWERAVNEYQELLDSGLMSDQAAFGIFGAEKHERLVSKGLLRPKAHDSMGQAYYERGEVERHAGIRDPSAPHVGCCKCCGHCPPDEPHIGTRRAKALYRTKSMSYSHDDNYDYDCERELGTSRFSELSPDVEEAMHDLNATFEQVVGKPVSPSVEAEHRALVKTFNRFVGDLK